jgi:hypothetical protein
LQERQVPDQRQGFEDPEIGVGHGDAADHDPRDEASRHGDGGKEPTPP